MPNKRRVSICNENNKRKTISALDFGITVTGSKKQCTESEDRKTPKPSDNKSFSMRYSEGKVEGGGLECQIGGGGFIWCSTAFRLANKGC